MKKSWVTKTEFYISPLTHNSSTQYNTYFVLNKDKQLVGITHRYNRVGSVSHGNVEFYFLPEYKKVYGQWHLIKYNNGLSIKYDELEKRMAENKDYYIKLDDWQTNLD